MNKRDSKSSTMLPEKLSLSKDFPIPSFEEWKEKVVKDLRGKPFDKLITNTIDGITLQPIYTRSTKNQNTHLDEYPTSGGRRALNSTGYYSNDWLINQKIDLADADEFNVALKDALKRGQNCINISLDKATILGLDADYAKTEDVGAGGLSISGINSFARALKDIELTKYPIIFESGFSPINIMAMLAAYCESNDVKIENLKCYIGTDPIGFLASEGELPITLEKAFNKIASAVKWTKSNAPLMKVISVNTTAYINSGANSTQELAIMLATSAEYIRRLLDEGCEINSIVKSIKIDLGIGTSFFNEVAKFRAAKILWRNLLSAFEADESLYDIDLFAVSSNFNKTIFDPYVNLLRGTTETFSAIVGGINGLQIAPFDSSFSLSDDFSRRIARNTQLVLKEESHFNTPIDPAGGSYFVEEFTEELAKKAWKEFQEIEKNGGMIEALKNNLVQSKINEIFQKRMEQISKRKRVIVGTNMYANPKEELLEKHNINNADIQKKRAEFLQKYRVSKDTKNNLEVLNSLSELANENSDRIIELAKSAFISGATIGEITSACNANSSSVESEKIVPVQQKRAAEMFEKLRLKSIEIEKRTGEKPSVFLSTIGTVKEYKARADFSRNFFEVGGFEVIYPNGFKSIDDALNATIKSGCKIAVLCSTDEKYFEFAKEFSKKIKRNLSDLKIVLAGYPKEHIEEFQQNGIDEFIYLGADSYKILSKMLEKFLPEAK